MSRRRRTPPDPGIFGQMVSESEAMARYALASGLPIPGPVLQTVAAGGALRAEHRAHDPSEGSGATNGEATSEFMKRLAPAHQQLARIVAPATPQTLLLLSHERSDAHFRFLRPVRLVRQMMLAAILLLVTFILTALSPDVNHSGGDILNSCQGPTEPAR